MNESGFRFVRNGDRYYKKKNEGTIYLRLHTLR